MTQLLDLSTLIDRPIVRIDGENYELRVREELGLLEFQRILKLHKQFTDLNEEDITEEQAKDALDALDTILVILGPDLPLERLSDIHKSSIAQAWAGQYAEEEVAADPTLPQTGAQSFPDSRPNTEEISATG